MIQNRMLGEAPTTFTDNRGTRFHSTGSTRDASGRRVTHYKRELDSESRVNVFTGAPFDARENEDDERLARWAKLRNKPVPVKRTTQPASSFEVSTQQRDLDDVDLLRNRAAKLLNKPVTDERSQRAGSCLSARAAPQIDRAGLESGAEWARRLAGKVR